MDIEKKKIKIVTLTIKADKLYQEKEKSLIFSQRKKGRGRVFIIFPKSQIFNFSKIIVYFNHWKNGREKHKAFKFDVPLWLFKKRMENGIDSLGDDAIIKNTYKDVC